VFLGVINESSRVVALYHYGDHKSPGDRTALGHQGLIELGEIDGIGQLGFSFQVKNGKLHEFCRYSSLNLKRQSLRFGDEFCITDDEMDDIIELIGLRRASVFKVCP
jgi:hypothetical protein